MPKLTKTQVEAAKAPQKGDSWLWDSEVEGFGVRIQASGRKTFVVRYRLQDRTQRKMTIGRCSDMAPEKARELARKVFTQVAEGRDPVAEQRATRDSAPAPTVAELKARFERDHAIPFKKASSVSLDEKNWRLHIIPRLGTLLVTDVARTHIIGMMADLSAMPAVANQCLALLSKAFNLAEEWEWRPRNTNPCHRVRKLRVDERETIISQEQVILLDPHIDALVADGSITQSFADLVRLLLITGCRLGEIMRAKRAWVDSERCLLLLPDSKVGQRKIPLAPEAMEIIEAMDAGQEWLIPGRVAGQPLSAPYKPWAALKAHAGLPPQMRLHDLRHTVGSLGHQNGMSQKQIAVLLGHKQLSTTERYIHGAAGERANVAAKMGSVIAGSWAKPAQAA